MAGLGLIKCGCMFNELCTESPPPRLNYADCADFQESMMEISHETALSVFVSRLVSEFLPRVNHYYMSMCFPK